MISLLILLILVWNFYIGYNRGIILQSFYSIGALVSLLVANRFYKPLAHQLTLWVPYSNPAEGVSTYFFKDVNVFDLDKVYYAGVAFFAIFVASYGVVRLVGVLVHFFPIDYFEALSTKLVSGFLAVLVSIIFLNMMLTILGTIPMPLIQEHLQASKLVRFLIEGCPPMTGILRQLWVKAMI
ncbi:CvpA family protein [Streptococcus ictaluri]|uniref:Colicin V production protein n=1 Tax=Streptococcus ictaluri 707-05 TaxID=764299 RepID=G5JZV6_9STRE|nr:CvpA family protein [Streptococcus ictaluri]EHI70718.1 colicin V production protein [Streptococcus ictaluri 707-05]